VVLAVALLAMLMWAHPVFGQPSAAQCGNLANAFGPFDYRTEKGERLHLVESAHFTPAVESLVRSVTGYIGADIDYTLRAFPNHHRALLSMMRLGERLKTPRVPNTNYEVECYFIRAITFRSNDTTVRMLYAMYLSTNQRKADALLQLSAARTLAGDNAFTHHNIGLLYMDLGEHELALGEAHMALSLGFSRPELKDRLVAAGKWAEPASSPASR
jgi:hypothetical protein